MTWMLNIGILHSFIQMLCPFYGESSLTQLYAWTTKDFFYSHSQAFCREHKAWVGRMSMEELSELITRYTEAFPCHDLEFFVLSLGHSPLLEYTTFLLGNLIKWATLFVSSNETGYAPSVQFIRSVMSNSLQAHGRQSSLPITNSQSLLKLMSIKSRMPSNHLIICHPLLLLLSIFPSICTIDQPNQ